MTIAEMRAQPPLCLPIDLPEAENPMSRLSILATDSGHFEPKRTLVQVMSHVVYWQHDMYAFLMIRQPLSMNAKYKKTYQDEIKVIFTSVRLEVE
jgi:hypothetical protein